VLLAQNGFSQLGYGEVCITTDDKCNPMKQFVCIGTKCGCSADELDDMHFNEAQDICLALSGGQCMEMVRTQPPKKCAASSQCVNQTAIDVEDGKCECNIGSVPDIFGLCKASHGGRCTSDQECISNSFLFCGADDKCVCDIKDAVWEHVSESESGCRSVLGGLLYLRNAIRNFFIFKMSISGECNDAGRACSVSMHLKCSSPSGAGMCECDTGYKEVDNGGCLLDIEQNCNSTATIPECHPDFTCRQEGQPGTGKCDCRDSEIKEEGKCFLKAGATCGDVIKTPCAEHSECLIGTCNCVEGFEVEMEVCKGLYDTPCSKEDACKSSHYLECKDFNSTTPGSCGCKTGYELNAENKCIGQLGAECADFVDCLSQNCQDNVCACFTDSEPFEGTCVVGYDADCSEWQCNKDFKLQCNSEQRCECTEGREYNQTMHSSNCLGLADTVCDPTILDCLSPALCSPGEAGTYICACPAGTTKDPVTRKCNPSGDGGGSATLTVSVLSLFLSVMVGLLSK
jgi:hypothetical protein